MSSEEIVFDKTYNKKSFYDKIKYIFENVKISFDTLQNEINLIRNEYDTRHNAYQDLLDKKGDIVIPDAKIIEKEYKMQKNMLQNDLIYAVNSRDIVFVEFYQDIYSVFENLISLEMGLKPDKMLLGYNNYKNHKLKDIRENINLNNQSFEELEKLKSVVLTTIKEIDILISKHNEYLDTLLKKARSGLDINTFCISMKTFVQKIEIELESNKSQFLYQMEDDLYKIHAINKKVKFINETEKEEKNVAML
jgi:hypothetical protein